MVKSPLDPKECIEIGRLVRRLSDAVPLTDREAGERNASFRQKTIDRVFAEGIQWGEASGDLPIYQKTEGEFFAHLRATDNELLEQIERFQFGLDRWFEYGEAHPPYFPWRIAIILSKRGEVDWERQFLACYCRHFHDRARRGSRRDEMLVDRAIKKKAWDYW